MENSSVGVEKVPKDKDVCSEDRRHLLTMLDMTIRQLWDMAYLAGYDEATKNASAAVDRILKPGSESQSRK